MQGSDHILCPYIPNASRLVFLCGLTRGFGPRSRLIVHQIQEKWTQQEQAKNHQQ